MDAQAADHAELKNPDGTWKYTNRLAGQTSPYLLQHAHNPVGWYPWGPEAFEKARREGKPIFLSVGYSTCYWCHVMERQSFENEAIAAVMNEHYVSIKVDREERPDVDDVYMTATQMMTGQGGWPMSVWLTPPGSGGDKDPGLKPFFAGTYFPPEPMHGRPGFPQVLEGLSQAWRERRGEVLEQAETVAAAVREQLERVGEPGPVGPGSVQTAANQLLRMYDVEHGGFGSAPKFPTPCYPRFLLAVYRNNPDEGLWRALAHTLDRMARGGMYDQVGGGFHRYSVDEKWLVPHFEKMLYDNGQLVELYAEAHEVRPKPQYARIMRETCDYVLREMTDATGAFWSAQDAEVNAMEGGNYVWTRQQVERAIDDEALRAMAVKMYGLDRGTNFQDPHHPPPESVPVNVLYLPEPLTALGDYDEVAGNRRAINQRLLAVRDLRDQPATDDKVLTSWNGLMIAGMAQAGRVLGEAKYVDAAGRAAEAVVQHMGRGDMVYRSMRGGDVRIPGFLEDYAMFVHGLVELHRAAGGGDWLDLARRYTAAAIERFEVAGGGYFDTLEGQADLFVRLRTVHDGAIPSGNSQMIHNLLDLHELTEEAAYLDRAARDLRSFADALNRNGANMSHMQHALLRALEAAPERFEGDAAPQAAAGPVAVSVSPQAVDLSSGEARVVVTLKIAEAYHINANKAAPDLIPTTIEIASPGGVAAAAAFPPAATMTFPFADQPLEVYTGRVDVPVTLRRTDGAAAGDAVLIVTYQACTHTACLAPQRVELTVRIR